jgi:hypothetical protein
MLPQSSEAWSLILQQRRERGAPFSGELSDCIAIDEADPR